MTDSSKYQLRDRARKARRELSDKDSVSRQILARLTSMPEFRQAKCVLWYVSLKDEVQTTPWIQDSLSRDQSVVVPYCVGDTLELFRCDSFEEFSIGAFGILEPNPRLRSLPERRVEPAQVDVAVIPGLAFDSSGGRLGYGKGFYDRLLCGLTGSATLVGLAFECQIFDSIPQSDHDVSMDWVVTETRSLRGTRGTRVHLGGEDC